MAATDSKIKKLVDRLCALPARQTEAFGIEPQTIRDELGGALKKFARDDAHAVKLTDWLIFERPADKRTWRPAAGEIREAGDAIAETERLAREEAAPAGCMKCAGTGWKAEARIGRDDQGRAEIQSDGATRCDCPRGQFLARKDRERASGSAA